MKTFVTFLCFLWSAETFAQDFTIFSISEPEIGSFTTGDYTGDQYEDILAIDYTLNSEATIYLYTNKKESTIAFTEKKLFTKIPFSGGPASGDLDGDGDVDVVYNNPLDKVLTALINDGNGNFTQMPLDIPEASGIIFIDFDKDGDNDMVGYSYPLKTLHILIGKRNDH